MAEFADVSVIVAAYQAAGTIARTLASIAGQTLKPTEVVVVDDGSSDGTFAAANAEADNMNGIALRVFRTEDNLGAGAARNRAIKEAKGSYLTFLDADDEWLPEKLERTMPHLEGGDYTLVAHDYVTGEGTSVRKHNCERRFRERDPFIGLYRKGYIPSGSVVTTREAVINAGGFDPSLLNAQDFDLWLEILKSPDTKFLVFGEPLLRYHVTPGGIMSHTQRRLRCALVIAERYFPDLTARPGSPWVSLWFRIAALHLEAFRAYAARMDILGVLAVGAMLPLRLTSVSFRCLISGPASRGRFLKMKGSTDDG